MGQNTKIEWADVTWNPVRGCSMAPGSEKGGCLNCYAALLAARNLPEMRSPTTGAAYARKTTSGPRWTGKVELIPEKLAEPLHWRKPRRCFVNSMSDLFHEALPFEHIAAVFGVMAASPRVTFQVLTKRAGRAAEFFGWVEEEAERIYRGRYPNEARGGLRRELLFDLALGQLRAPCPGMPTGGLQAERWPLPNVWLGTSVENQETADARIPLLLQCPAAVRFLSYEPALGAIDLGAAPAYVDWVIVGGESGPGARPFDIGWARSIVEQCRASGVACFVKQLGANPWVKTANHFGPGVDAHPYNARYQLKDRKGGDWNEWPADLRVREFPGAVA